VRKIYDTAEVKRSLAVWALRRVRDHPGVTMVLSGLFSSRSVKSWRILVIKGLSWRPVLSLIGFPRERLF